MSKKIADITATEIFLPVLGYDFPYSAGSLGTILCHRYGRRCPLKTVRTARGYLAVQLQLGGRTRRVTVHKLIARSFLGERPAALQVDHVDGVKVNNAVFNLEYVTNSENRRRASMLGLLCKKMSRVAVAEAIAAHAHGETYGSLARRFGVTEPCIAHHVRRQLRLANDAAAAFFAKAA